MSHTTAQHPAISVKSPFPFERRIVPAICLAVAIITGLVLLWVLLTGWLMSMGTSDVHWVESIQVTEDGTPLISRYTFATRESEYFTLDRKPYARTGLEKWINAVSVNGPLSARQSDRSDRPFLVAYGDREVNPTVWYFVRLPDSSRSAYFVGYDYLSHSRVGYLGQKGFQPEEPALADRFHTPATSTFPDINGIIVPRYASDGTRDGAGYFVPSPWVGNPMTWSIPPWVCHVLVEDRLLRIDLQKRTVQSVFAAPHMLSVAETSKTPPGANAGRQEKEMMIQIVRAGDTLTLLDANARMQGVYHLPAELSDRNFELYLAPNRNAAAAFSRRNAQQSGWTHCVILFGPDGNVRQRALDVTEPSTEDNGGLRLFVVAPEFALSALFILGSELPLGPSGDVPSYASTIRHNLTLYWPHLLFTTVIGVICVVIYARHAKRIGARPRVGWIVLVFAGGIPGLLGYWWHRRWPVQLPCPVCGQTTPRDRETCLRCGREFPAPAANGLEVFA